jgi:gliding motility-associated-like protein
MNQENGGNATSCFQAYFSEDPFHEFTINTLNLEPQAKNKRLNYMRGINVWRKVEMVFKAEGNENYVTLGCFDDSANIIMLDYDESDNEMWLNTLYVAIDSVSLESIDVKISFPNVFTPNEDGINDTYYPSIDSRFTWTARIYNRWGNVVAKLDDENPSWDGMTNGTLAAEGNYFYQLEIPEWEILESGFFHLLRD